MLDAGRRPSDAARQFCVAAITIRRLRNRLAQTGAVDILPRSGRPRVERHNVKSGISGHHTFGADSKLRQPTARNTRVLHDRSIHGRTVQRRLKQIDL